MGLMSTLFSFKTINATKRYDHEVPPTTPPLMGWELPNEHSPPEEVIHNIRSSDRLLFDSDITRCIIQQQRRSGARKRAEHEQTMLELKETTAVTLESEDPYMEFRVSMEEVVSGLGLEVVRDWEPLQYLLNWYLSVNVENTHDIIFVAFLDLVLDLSSTIY